MIIGWYLLFCPVYSLLGWFPLFGQFISSIGKFIGIVIGLIMGTLLSTVVIAIAWLFYRPKIGIILLFIIGLIFGYIAYSYYKAGRPNL